MLIDCNDCKMQDTRACHDCIVTHVLHDAGQPLALGDTDSETISLLTDEGLVPRLRMVPKSAAG